MAATSSRGQKLDVLIFETFAGVIPSPHKEALILNNWRAFSLFGSFRGWIKWEKASSRPSPPAKIGSTALQNTKTVSINMAATSSRGQKLDVLIFVDTSTPFHSLLFTVMLMQGKRSQWSMILGHRKRSQWSMVLGHPLTTIHEKSDSFPS